MGGGSPRRHVSFVLHDVQTRGGARTLRRMSRDQREVVLEGEPNFRELEPAERVAAGGRGIATRGVNPCRAGRPGVVGTSSASSGIIRRKMNAGISVAARRNESRRFSRKSFDGSVCVRTPVPSPSSSTSRTGPPTVLRRTPRLRVVSRGDSLRCVAINPHCAL
jgi:hypothetical protein